VDFGSVADGATRVSCVTQDRSKGCSLEESECILKTEVRSTQQYSTDTVCQVNFLSLKLPYPIRSYVQPSLGSHQQSIPIGIQSI
jgi:hypothetical protein